MDADTRPAALDASGGPDAWSEFRVDHPGERLALLRQLRDAATPVSLVAPGGHTLSTDLWAVDDEHGKLSFSVDARRPDLDAVVEADELTAVAYLDSVKLQFELPGVTLVHGRQAAVLQSGLPREVYRFQRRGAYRVRTLDRHAPTVHLRHPAMPEMTLALRVVDISIGGCALLAPHDVPPLEPGIRIDGVRVDLDGQTRLDLALRLQHVTALHPEQQHVRLGCEWLAMAAVAERQLQRFIDQTQKQRRLLSLK